MILQLKEGVIVRGNKYINKILEAVQLVYAKHEWNMVVTSGNDSTHSVGSYHGQDRALDIRFWDIPAEHRRGVADEITALLPGYYDVVMETDHYHIEADAQKERRASVPVQT